MLDLFGKIRGLVVLVLAVLLLVGCAYGKHMSKGDDYFEQGNYEAALAEYEAAKEIDPESQEVADKIRQTKEKLVGEYAAEARQKLDAGDHLGAVTAAQRAHEKLPDASSVRDLVREVSQETQDAAAALESEKDYANALVLYGAVAEKLPPERAAAETRITEIKEIWAGELVETAKAAEEAGRRGDAFLLYAKATQLTGNPEYGGKRDALRAELRKAWTYQIVPRGSSRDAGFEFIVDGLVEKSDRDTLVIAEPNASTEAANATMKIRVRRPRFRTERDTRSETARYQSGTKQVENPFYEQRKDDVLDAEKRLVDDQNDVSRYQSEVDDYQQRVAQEGPSPNTSTSAEQGLSRARSNLERARRSVEDQRRRVQREKEELAREPQFKEEPVYSDHVYNVTRHTLIGTVKLDGRIKHDDGREAIEFDSEIQTSASDDAHPAQPIANVPEDPLDLPPESQLTDELYRKALDATAAAIDRSFNDWRARILEKAKAEPDDDARANLYAIYVLTNPQAVSPEVAAEISALRGIPDVVKLMTVE